MAEHIERLAVSFPDGSMSVFEREKAMTQAIKEVAEDDPHEHDPEMRGKLVRVSIIVMEEIPTPSPHVTGKPCPKCGRTG